MVRNRVSFINTVAHLLCALLTAAVFVSCAGGASGKGLMSDEPEETSLTIKLPTTKMSRTIWNLEDVEEFTVTLASAANTYQKTAPQGGEIRFSAIPAGLYEINAVGKKSTGQVTARGEASVDIVAGVNRTVSMELHRTEYYVVSFHRRRDDAGSLATASDCYEKQKVTEGYAATAPVIAATEVPVKFGCEAVGWYTSTNNGKTLSATEYDFTAPVTNDVELYAKWKNPSNGMVFVEGNGSMIPDLLVCDHEVTQGEYEAYCWYGGGASKQPGDGGSYPAYYVNWYDTLVYCNKRSEAEAGVPEYYEVDGDTDPGLWDAANGHGAVNNGGKFCGPSSSVAGWNDGIAGRNNNGYRLPTTAEWEWIAKGGVARENYTYSGSNSVGDVAWHSGNSDTMPHAVKTDKISGKDSANSLGVYDMCGNVWEFCFDITSGSSRSRRGGYWNSGANWCKIASADSSNPSERVSMNGFRIVRNAQ